ncbi:putative O-glycosylation ligase, exosortase A system-associated [Sediminicurvatus halobius]|uniref:Putative O-glycosylation ligase, exosortase A system-associated n=1 Tax=Sediminicurvatus halobius TaxID=2182432 RepID=A0A2U2N0G9_9GAMM|nr:putative O-glycosylation ligase, exosortase A system-associated [Spiribacter halobius]PWG62676.1 putative O-glycosylation ligase, exosortase A system-associated [Spiribacter halobius]UEX77345.1 putative O-glycosylation ligase, exosortase A system-associated [Spiribacter halobius]
MRAILLTAIVFAMLPMILRQPYFGVLAWSWMSYMNPHRFAWGFATDMSYALMIAVCTLIGLMLARNEPKRIPWTRESLLLLIFTLWMFFTTTQSLYPWLAWDQWDKVWRIQLMTFVTMMLIYTPQRIHLLMWVITLSLAFFGIKGGWFTLSTGGAHRVLGPANSFIADRNSIGLALIMTIPMLRYLQLQAQHKWLKLVLTVSIALTMISIIGTHSRGALVGGVAMLGFFLLKSRGKAGVLLLVVPVVLATPYFMPEKYFDRMETIQNWEEDNSASERVRAWGNAVDLANHRFIGGGFRALVYWGGRDSHSIFFGTLGEHGWLGLAMFMLLLLFTWRSASYIIRHSRRDPELYWARDLAAMLQVSLVGYCGAGAFLGLQYFDLYYSIIAIVVVTKLIVQRKVAGQEALAPASDALPLPARLASMTRVLGGPLRA